METSNDWELIPKGGTIEIGDQLRHDHWGLPSGYWTVLDLDDFDVDLRWTSYTGTEEDAIAKTGIAQFCDGHWFRKIQELKYDPTQQGDLEEDL